MNQPHPIFLASGGRSIVCTSFAISQHKGNVNGLRSTLRRLNKMEAKHVLCMMFYVESTNIE